MTFCFADSILSFTDGNVEYLLCKLGGIARTFGHEASMPQFSGYFETETLPKLRLSLETRVAEDVTVICCKGRIAYGIEAAALSGEIAELAAQTRRVVIDLSGVEMIDAAGLGALISVALTAQASQCSVKLAAPGNLVRQLLELTKLTSVFEVHPTLDAATVASRRQAA
jgi:anti-sigma B factor antagonist